MERTVKLSSGNLLLKEYQSNIEAFFDEQNISYSFDGCIENTTEENVNDFIDRLNDIIKLTAADIELLKEKLQNVFYMHSSEVFN